jgi:serine/threonine protein kinase/alpha-tubulin suppressor-like RCC1 family protein
MGYHQPVNPGDIVGGQFRILRQFGAGGMGTVFLAEQQNIGRTVVIKFMQPHLSDQQRHVARFRREATLLSMIHHPNVVVVHSFGETDQGDLYLVMEYLEGQSLAQFLLDREPFQLGRAFDIIEQILGALVQAHSCGVVHRDLKPDNIILTHTADNVERVKVLDFGIASFTHDNLTALTQDNAVIGTPRYMSPEQVNGQPSDARSDLYSLGIIFYELLTGEHPLIAQSQVQFLLAHITQTIEPPSTKRVDIPAAVDEIVLKALTRDITHRFSSAREMLSAMQSIRQSLSLSAMFALNVQSDLIDEDSAGFVTTKMSAVSSDPSFYAQSNEKSEKISSLLQSNAPLSVQDIGLAPTANLVPPTDEQRPFVLMPGMVVYGLGPGPNWLLPPTDDYIRPDVIHFIPAPPEEQEKQREIRRAKEREAQRKRDFLAQLSKRHKKNDPPPQAAPPPHLLQRLTLWRRHHPSLFTFSASLTLSTLLFYFLIIAWRYIDHSTPYAEEPLRILVQPKLSDEHLYFPDFKNDEAKLIHVFPSSASAHASSAPPLNIAISPSKPNPDVSLAALSLAPKRRIQRIFAGTHVTYALLSNGQLAAWGYNMRGQLGIGITHRDSAVPILVQGLPSPVIDLAVGGGTNSTTDTVACALLLDQRVFCWGHSQLIPDINNEAQATPVEVASLYKSKKISLGSFHGCALLADQSISCWGLDTYTGLGLKPPFESRHHPYPISIPGPWIDLVAGSTHTCALHERGEIWCWGVNSEKQVNPQIKEQFVKTPTILMTWPYKQLNLTISDQNSYLYDESDFIINAWGQGFSRMETFATQVKSISAGYKNICILHIDDRLLCFGDQTRGQLGTGLVGSRIIPKDRARPVELPDKDSLIAQVAVGYEHACALLDNDRVFCWGNNTFGALGDGSTDDQAAPVEVTIPSDEGFDAATPYAPDSVILAPPETLPKPPHLPCQRGTQITLSDERIPLLRWQIYDVLGEVSVQSQNMLRLRFANFPLPPKLLAPFEGDPLMRGDRALIVLSLSSPLSTTDPSVADPALSAPSLPLGVYSRQNKEQLLSKAYMIDRYFDHSMSFFSDITTDSVVEISYLDHEWACGTVSLKHKYGIVTGTFAVPLLGKD